MQSIPLDEHGQPPRSIARQRLDARDLAEMLGLCKGVICDGVVSDAEAVALTQWIAKHPDVAVQYPGRELHERLRDIFEDGTVDDGERAELEELLTQLVGEPDDLAGSMVQATRHGFDNPPPSVLFDGRTFCFTGQFACGTRGWCEAEVVKRGGRVVSTPTVKTHYVVVGLTASDAWRSPTYGTKYEKAMEYREKGHSVALITEEHWLEAISIDA